MSEIKSNRAWREECESLRQRIADLTTGLEACDEQVVALRQQLAAALAAIKVKDAAIQIAVDYAHNFEEVDFLVGENALAIQPNDSALKAWLGEPVAWKHDDPKRHDAITDSVKELLHRANSEYMHRPIDKTEHYTIPLYSPKGLK